MVTEKIRDVTSHWQSNAVVWHACHDKNFPFLTPRQGILTIYTPTYADFSPFKENTDTPDTDCHWSLNDGDIIADTKEECVTAFNGQIQKAIDKLTVKYDRAVQHLKDCMV